MNERALMTMIMPLGETVARVKIYEKQQISTGATENKRHADESELRAWASGAGSVSWKKNY